MASLQNAPYENRNSPYPLLIQGGMGVGVSNWRLAKAVSSEGQLGVVSGTGINTILIRRLQDGDKGADVRRALSHFPDHEIAQEIIKTFWLEKGRLPGQPYKRSPLPSIDASISLQRLNAVSSFVEVFLAKEGHEGIVGINFLEKLQTSNLPGIYGAMLAGVDYVLMGAGVPREIPGVLDCFARNEKTSIKVSLSVDLLQGPDLHVSFDPLEVFPALSFTSLKKPKFLAIVSSGTLALHLARKSTGKVDGFVVENNLAGGHNAPPRGPMRLTEKGEPIYGPKDEADLKILREIGLPFWLAGSYASSERLSEALKLGAEGIQVGTAFAFCNESGLSEHLRNKVIQKWCFAHSPSDVASAKLSIFTDPLASPTGFPFKVVPLDQTLSDDDLFSERPRKCDLGYLRQVTRDAAGTVIYRCPAEPVQDFIKKGGTIEETTNRKCLCNALMSNIGIGQVQENGYEELPLLTAGSDLTQLKQFLPEGLKNYSARDVIFSLLK